MSNKLFDQLKQEHNTNTDKEVKKLVFPEPKHTESKLDAALKQGDISTRTASAKPVFQDAVSPATQLALDYIGKTYPDMMEHKEQLLFKIKQLYPLELTNILTWGKKSGTDISEITDTLTDVMNTFTAEKSSDKIEEAINALSNKGFFKVFSKELNESELHSLKNRLFDLLNRVSSLDVERADFRLKISMTSLISVKETNRNQDQLILNTLDGQSSFLASLIQQSMLNKIKLDQLKQIIVSQIEKLDQILTVTIPATKASRPPKK